MFPPLTVGMLRLQKGCLCYQEQSPDLTTPLRPARSDLLGLPAPRVMWLPLFTGGFMPRRGPTQGMALRAINCQPGGHLGPREEVDLRKGCLPPPHCVTRRWLFREGAAQWEVSHFSRAPRSWKQGAGEGRPPCIAASCTYSLIIFKIFVC